MDECARIQVEFDLGQVSRRQGEEKANERELGRKEEKDCWFGEGIRVAGLDLLGNEK